MRRSPLSAFTLAEVLLASALLAVLTAVLGGLLVSQMKISARTDRNIALERGHLMLQESMRHHVALATAASTSLAANGQSLALQFSGGATVDGILTYDTRQLAYYAYTPSDKKLRLRFWSVAPPLTLQSPPLRLSSADWSTLTTAGGGTLQTWDHLEQCRFRSETPGSISRRLWVDCDWRLDGRSWQISYCLLFRQNL